MSSSYYEKATCMNNYQQFDYHFHGNHKETFQEKSWTWKIVHSVEAAAVAWGKNEEERGREATFTLERNKRQSQSEYTTM